MSTTQRCPHCARTYHAFGYDRHVVACPCRAELRCAIVDAMTGEDGYAAPRGVYEQRAADGGLPSPATMRIVFGTWSAALVHFGFPQRPREVIQRRRGGCAPECDPLLVGAVRVRDDYGEFDGLPVAGVRSLDGGGTAYMLR